MGIGITNGTPTIHGMEEAVDIGQLPRRHHLRAMRKHTEMSAGESTLMYKMGIHQ